MSPEYKEIIENILKEVLSITGLTIGTLSLLLIKKVRSWLIQKYLLWVKGAHKFSKKSLKKEYENNFAIKGILFRLLAKLSANRVSYFHLHNGGQDVLGISFKKMSIGIEVTDEATASCKERMQAIPLSNFPTILKAFVENDQFPYFIDPTLSKERDEKSIFQMNGTKYAMFMPIYIHNILYGGICISYTSGKPDDSIMKIAKQVLPEFATLLSAQQATLL